MNEIDMTNNNQTWEERFEEKFNEMLNLVESQIGVSERENVKDFIRSELQTQKLELLQDIRDKIYAGIGDKDLLSNLEFWLNERINQLEE